MADGMSGRLAGKVALIIGAARGIGAGIAERFHEEGAQVMIGDTEAEAGAATAERLKGKFVATDISKPADAERAVEATLAAYGDLHIVVQNAGIYPWSLIENISPEEWDMVLGVNLRGTFLIARAALPHMKAKRYGRWCSPLRSPAPVSPVPATVTIPPPRPASTASSNRRRWNSPAYNITVNGVEPGNILTESIEKQRSPAFIQSMVESIPLGRLGTPRDVAQAALFLASDEAAYITGDDNRR